MGMTRVLALALRKPFFFSLFTLVLLGTSACGGGIQGSSTATSTGPGSKQHVIVSGTVATLQPGGKVDAFVAGQPAASSEVNGKGEFSLPIEIGLADSLTVLVTTTDNSDEFLLGALVEGVEKVLLTFIEEPTAIILKDVEVMMAPKGDTGAATSSDPITDKDLSPKGNKKDGSKKDGTAPEGGDSSSDSPSSDDPDGGATQPPPPTENPGSGGGSTQTGPPPPPPPSGPDDGPGHTSQVDGPPQDGGITPPEGSVGGGGGGTSGSTNPPTTGTGSGTSVEDDGGTIIGGGSGPGMCGLGKAMAGCI